MVAFSNVAPAPSASAHAASTVSPAPFGVDEVDKAPAPAPGREQGQQLGIDDPFPVVRNDHHVVVIEPLLHKRVHARVRTRVKSIPLFSVESYHLLAMSDDTRLAGC